MRYLVMSTKTSGEKSASIYWEAGFHDMARTVADILGLGSVEDDVEDCRIVRLGEYPEDESKMKEVEHQQNLTAAQAIYEYFADMPGKESGCQEHCPLVTHTEA